ASRRGTSAASASRSARAVPSASRAATISPSPARTSPHAACDASAPVAPSAPRRPSSSSRSISLSASATRSAAESSPATASRASARVACVSAISRSTEPPARSPSRISSTAAATSAAVDASASKGSNFVQGLDLIIVRSLSRGLTGRQELVVIEKLAEAEARPDLGTLLEAAFQIAIAANHRSGDVLTVAIALEPAKPDDLIDDQRRRHFPARGDEHSIAAIGSRAAGTEKRFQIDDGQQLSAHVRDAAQPEFAARNTRDRVRHGQHLTDVRP